MFKNRRKVFSSSIEHDQFASEMKIFQGNFLQIMEQVKNLSDMLHKIEGVGTASGVNSQSMSERTKIKTNDYEGCKRELEKLQRDYRDKLRKYNREKYRKAVKKRYETNTDHRERNASNNKNSLDQGLESQYLSAGSESGRNGKCVIGDSKCGKGSFESSKGQQDDRKKKKPKCGLQNRSKQGNNSAEKLWRSSSSKSVKTYFKEKIKGILKDKQQDFIKLVVGIKSDGAKVRAITAPGVKVNEATDLDCRTKNTGQPTICVQELKKSCSEDAKSRSKKQISIEDIIKDTLKQNTQLNEPPSNTPTTDETGSEDEEISSLLTVNNALHFQTKLHEVFVTLNDLHRSCIKNEESLDILSKFVTDIDDRIMEIEETPKEYYDIFKKIIGLEKLATAKRKIQETFKDNSACRDDQPNCVKCSDYKCLEEKLQVELCRICKEIKLDKIDYGKFLEENRKYLNEKMDMMTEKFHLYEVLKFRQGVLLKGILDAESDASRPDAVKIFKSTCRPYEELEKLC